jgi:hypothetical protein
MNYPSFERPRHGGQGKVMREVMKQGKVASDRTIKPELKSRWVMADHTIGVRSKS